MSGFVVAGHYFYDRIIPLEAPILDGVWGNYRAAAPGARLNPEQLAPVGHVMLDCLDREPAARTAAYASRRLGATRDRSRHGIDAKIFMPLVQRLSSNGYASTNRGERSASSMTVSQSSSTASALPRHRRSA